MRFLGPASKDVEPNTFKRLPSIELVESAENPANCSVTATDKDTVPLQDSHRYGGFGGFRALGFRNPEPSGQSTAEHTLRKLRITGAPKH